LKSTLSSVIDGIISQYIKHFKLYVNRIINDNNIKSSLNIWTSNNSFSPFVFSYPPKPNSLTSLFIKYVLRRQRRNLPATKRDFYKTVLGYKINVGKLSPEEFNQYFDKILSSDKIKKSYGTYVYNPVKNHKLNLNGHNTQFFSSITDSGILSREGQFYTIGPNYNHWKNKTLKRDKH
jgi:hypothetical protein